MSEHNIRPLKGADVFVVVKILRKVGAKDLKSLLTPERLQGILDAAKERKKDQNDEINATGILGAGIVLEILDIVTMNLPLIESDLNTFLGDLIGKKPDEVSDLPMGEYADLIVDVIKAPGFPDFFKAVSRLLN